MAELQARRHRRQARRGDGEPVRPADAAPAHLRRLRRRRRRPAKRRRRIVMHPTSNFMGHYLIGPLAERGIACLGLNSRYVGNDTVLLMERVIQDLGAGVKFLRDARLRARRAGRQLGRRRARRASTRRRPSTSRPRRFVDGDPTHLVAADLPPVDGLALCAAHEGRSQLLLRLDRPVGDRRARPARRSIRRSTCTTRATAAARTRRRIPARASAPAQRARRDRIEALGAASACAQLRSDAGRAARRGLRRLPHARRPALPRPDARRQRPRARAASGATRARSTTRANAMGRTTSLTAFLSQWSSRVARRRPDEPGAHLGAGAAAHLHRRPEHLPEHARRLAAAPAASASATSTSSAATTTSPAAPTCSARVADEIAAFAETL